MIQLRPYQQESINAVLQYWRNGGGNPLVDLATGLGKSVVIGKLTRDLTETYPDMRVLMLVHVRELVAQNFQALVKLWPQAPAGIYSAGLGRRDAHHQITFASIQSVYKRARDIGPRDLILIDEAHLVPSGGDGMYRTLIDALRKDRPDLRVAGFSATPYRMDSGRLDQGEARLFDEVVYSYGVGAGIRDGWLSPLISKASATEIDVSGVAKRGGEFISGALEAAVDQDRITTAAVAEMLRYGADRRSWLVFCAGVKHAHNVRDAIRAQGISCETITGETDAGNRARWVADFKSERLRCLTNANVLTTGFDAPGLDLIAMLRPTLSTGLYVQMCGRGTRLAEGKTNCLVLDFAGVVRRHGPVDTVEIRPKKEGGGKEGAVDEATVRAKSCPHCDSLQSLAALICEDCGYVWPVEAPKPRHDETADDTPILSTEASALIPEDVPVLRWEVRRHEKFGAPDSMRVVYFAGLMTYPEWVTFEHPGFARRKAERWWRQHGGAEPIPETVDDGMARFGELIRPDVIQTRRSGRWHEIVGRRFPQSQEVAA